MYSIGWAVLKASSDPENPSLSVVERASKPILEWNATQWTLGKRPWPCKQPNIAFVEGAEALGDDSFRLFFGAADASEGTAIVRVML